MRKTIYVIYTALFLVLLFLLAFGLFRYSKRGEAGGWQPTNIPETESETEGAIPEEAVYLEKVQECEEQGDLQGQRLALIELHRHYPSVEYVRRINEIAVEKEDSDPQVAELLTLFWNCFDDHDAGGLRSLVGSEEWSAQMQDDLAGVRRKTEISGEQEIWILSDTEATTVICRFGEEDYRYFAADASGMMIGEFGFSDGAYNGGCRISYFDETDAFVRSFSGELEENITKGSFEIAYNENIYHGTMKEDGKTAEEQIEEVTEDGNVIYAYAEDGTYLYEPDASEETFVIDRNYLGLPETLGW